MSNQQFSYTSSISTMDLLGRTVSHFDYAFTATFEPTKALDKTTKARLEVARRQERFNHLCRNAALGPL